jgi:hypothetical protein
MRAALFQAMARDVNGRFDTAQAFGNALRNAVATLGGPASPADLGRLLLTDFGDEMAARDEILKAADEPAPPPRALRTTSPPPLPASALQTGATGEIGGPDDSQPGRTSAQMEAVPSMIVQQSSARAHAPSGRVIDLSGNLLPDSWMIDPNTDLLRSHRLRSIRNAAIALGAVALITLVVFLITSRLGDATNRTVAAQPPPDAPVPIDAEPPVDAPTGPTRDDIVALSHYGFFSIAATAKTQIYIDNKMIGETPLTRLPLAPGPHKVKAIGPRGKSKLLNINVYGGQDTDEGTITW